mgnify:CR=1 FL=1
MAVHEVQFEVPRRPVGNADIEFVVRQNGKMFGRLKISKGSVVWLPGNKIQGYRIGWKKLDEIMRENGRRGSFPV